MILPGLSFAVVAQEGYRSNWGNTSMQSAGSGFKRSQPSKVDLLEALLEQLEIKEIQKQYLRSRWFEKLVDADRQAKLTRRWYMRLHIITLTGGVLLPGVVGMQVFGPESKGLQLGIAIGTLVVAKIVAITAAAEHFLRYGERWQDYQRSADSLDAEGWQFMQLAGNYQTYQTHDQAYVAFVNNVEQLIKGEEAASIDLGEDEDEDSQLEVQGGGPQGDTNRSVDNIPLHKEPIKVNSNCE